MLLDHKFDKWLIWLNNARKSLSFNSHIRHHNLIIKWHKIQGLASKFKNSATTNKIVLELWHRENIKHQIFRRYTSPKLAIKIKSYCFRHLKRNISSN